MGSIRLVLIVIATAALASCGKPETAKNGSGDPCNSAKARPPYVTQEEAVKACKADRNFAGAPTKRSSVRITNH